MAAHTNIVERNRLYGKTRRELAKLAQRGATYRNEFFAMARDYLANDKYWALADVFSQDHGIDLWDTAKLGLNAKLDQAWKKLLSDTAPTEARLLASLSSAMGVYQVGNIWYHAPTNFKLGTINVVDADGNWPYYKDTALVEKRDRAALSDLVCERGYSVSQLAGFPTYATSGTFTWSHGDVCFYGPTAYACISAHVQSPSSPISPTYSQYWKRFASWTYSKLEITDNNKKQEDKYAAGIDFLLGAF